MSRRRAQKQQEKEDFLDQNPELIKFETEIDVVPNFDNGMPNLMDPFGLVGSDNDGPEYQFFADGNVGSTFDPLATIAEFLDGPDLVLFANNSGGNPHLSLSAAGLGIYSMDEQIGGGEPSSGFDQINAGERLGIQAIENNSEYPGNGQPIFVFDEPLAMETLEIEFTGTGRGTVEIDLYSDYYGRSSVLESEFIFGDGETVHTFEVEMPGNFGSFPFDTAGITTTGSLGVSLVGINYETNYEAGTGGPDIFI